MRASFENDKIIVKKLFGTQELAGKDIKSIELSAEGTTIRLKDQDKSLFCKGQIFHAYLYPEFGRFIVDNQITYTEKNSVVVAYSGMKAQEMVEQTKEAAQEILAEKIKKCIGDRYDAQVEVVGDLSYSILVLRIVKDGVVIYEHPHYERVEELGVDKAIDALDLTWLESFDAYSGEGTYGVTEEVCSIEALNNYLADDSFEKILEKIGAYEKAQ